MFGKFLTVMLNYLVVIPARYKSKRLPGKPLLAIKKIPMLVRTFRKCSKCVDVNKILVATDDSRILNLCKRENIKCVMTSKKCLTGTDRVAEVAKKFKAKIYINVQADEPLLQINDLKKLIYTATRNPKEIINGYCELKNKKMYFDRNTIKILINQKEKLIYISRAPIPNNKKNKFIKAWRQVCIYSFPRTQLLKFASIKKKSQLEEIEDIEILRFLELGYSIKMLKMSSKSISVDTKEDLRKVERLIRI